MAACRSAIERKTPRRMRWRVILEKKFSTALSHEAEVGVVGTTSATFAPDFSGRGGFAGPSLLSESIKPGDDRCISLSGHESLRRLPQRSIAGEELAVNSSKRVNG